MAKEIEEKIRKMLASGEKLPKEIGEAKK
jgi:hypothetical protein